MTNPHTLSRAEEQRIDDKILRGIREYFKNGMPSGTYSTYQWDGTRIVGAGGGASAQLVIGTANIASSTGGSAVTFASVGWDTGGYTDVSLDKFIIPHDGHYLFQYEISWENNPNGYRYSYIDAAGTIIARELRIPPSTTPFALLALTGTGAISLAAGDEVQLIVAQNSGGTRVATDVRFTIMQV